KFVAAHDVALIARLHATLAMVRDRAGPLVDRIGAEIGDVSGERRLRLLARRLLPSLRYFAVGCDMTRHVAVNIVDDDALGDRAAPRPRLAVDGRADMAPCADQPPGIR